MSIEQRATKDCREGKARELARMGERINRMSNDLHFEEEPRIRALTKEIVAILNGPLADKLKELFEGIGE